MRLTCTGAGSNSSTPTARSWRSPPLKRVWPQGMPSLDDDRKDALQYARKDFEAAWEALDRDVDDGAAARRVPRRARRVGGGRAAGCGRLGRVTVLGAGRRGAGAVPEPGRHRHRAGRARSGPTATSVRWCSVIDPVDSLRRPPTTGGPPPPSTGWKSCCARTASRSASSPTAAGGGWCAPGPRRHGGLRHRRRPDLDRGAAHP